MQENLDPVDSALRSLAGGCWPKNGPDLETEQKLMRDFEANRRARVAGHRRVWLPALVVLVLGGVVFAAAGGVDMVRGWFMTVTVEVDGEVVAVEDVVLDEQGQATITLPADAMENGEELTFSIDAGEVPGDVESGTATIEISVEDNAAQIAVQMDEDPEE